VVKPAKDIGAAVTPFEQRQSALYPGLVLFDEYFCHPSVWGAAEPPRLCVLVTLPDQLGGDQVEVLFRDGTAAVVAALSLGSDEFPLAYILTLEAT